MDEGGFEFGVGDQVGVKGTVFKRSTSRYDEVGNVSAIIGDRILEQMEGVVQRFYVPQFNHDDGGVVRLSWPRNKLSEIFFRPLSEETEETTSS